MRFWILGLSLACTTGADTSDATSADAATGDSGTTDIDRTALTFRITGDFEGTSFAVVEFDQLTSDPTEPWFTAVPKSNDFTVELEAPPADHLLPTAAFPRVRSAFYLAGLHVDPNQNTWPDPGEVYVGVTQLFLIYYDVGGELPKAITDDGFVKGWNALSFYLKDGEFVLYPLGDLALPVIPPSTQVTVSGSYDGTDAPHVAWLPQTEIDAPGTVDMVFVDEVVGASWSLTVDQEPPSNHASPGLLGYPEGASLQTAVPYVDEDASGDWSKGDTPLPLTACDEQGTSMVQLLWLPQTDNIERAGTFRGATGWMATKENAGGVLETLGTAATGLTLGDCRRPDGA